MIEMPADVLDDAAVVVGAAQGIAQLGGDRSRQAQFAPREAVHGFCMIGVQHQQRDGVGAEDLEILERQVLQVTQHGPLRHDVDPRRAHRADHVVIHDRLRCLDPQPAEPFRVGREGVLGPRRRSLGRRRIPPQADEGDAADLVADLLERRQQLAGNLSPAPPVVAEVEDIVLLGGRRGRVELQSRVVPVERHGLRARLDGRGDGGLHDLAAERIEVIYPARPLGLARMIEVVAVDRDHGIVHAVRVHDQPVALRKSGEDGRLAHPSDAVELGLVDVHDAVEAADVRGELQLRHVPDRSCRRSRRSGRAWGPAACSWRPHACCRRRRDASSRPGRSPRASRTRAVAGERCRVPRNRRA